jgi:ankyrin repeat protein
MNIKKLLPCFLAVLLFSSCFNTSLYMGDVDKGDSKANGDSKLNNPYDPDYLDEEFINLIDDEETTVETIMEFIKANEKTLKDNKIPFIHYIVQRGEYDLLTRLLDNYGDLVNYKGGEDSYTPLHLAAQKGDIKILELFINKGADINATDKNGNTALHYACSTDSKNNKKIVAKLIEEMNLTKSSDDLISLKNSLNCSPFYMAVRSGNLQIFKLLLSYIDKPQDLLNILETKGERNLIEIALFHNSSSLLNFFITKKDLFTEQNINKAVKFAKELEKTHLVHEFEKKV